MDEFDVDRFRSSDGESHRRSTAPAAQPSRAPNKRSGELFLKGPVPMPWLAAAAKLSGRAFAVGVLLWFFAGLTKSMVIKFTGKRQSFVRDYEVFRGKGVR
jgi:hypothetical protein